MSKIDSKDVAVLGMFDKKLNAFLREFNKQCSWKIRRRVVISSLIFCALMIVSITFSPNLDANRVTIATTLGWVALSLTIAFITSATFEDVKKIKANGNGNGSNNERKK